MRPTTAQTTAGTGEALSASWIDMAAPHFSASPQSHRGGGLDDL